MNLRFVIIKYVVFNLDGTGTEQKQYCSYTLFRDGTVTDHETWAEHGPGTETLS